MVFISEKEAKSMEEITIKNGKIGLIKGDITDLETESFVFYAQHNLKLGSGFGNAISMRGGPSIQEELSRHGEAETGDVILTEGGNLKSKYILHAVGPRFQEADIEEKLRKTVLNCLKTAENKGIKEIIFPAMGAGFYGVPLKTSASVTLEAIKEFLSNSTGLASVKVCLLDNHEYAIFENVFSELAK